MRPVLERRRFIGFAAATVAAPGFSPAADPDWLGELERIRTKHGLPALGAAFVSSDGKNSIGVTGFRKAGEKTAVTAGDLWHLGSNTKAMTATLAAIAVAEGRLRWDSTLGETFPDNPDLKNSPLAKATLAQLLSHWSGVPANSTWGLFGLNGEPLREQRAIALQIAARTRDLPAPGTRHEYSNWGYTLAGHLLERVWDSPWEKLMETRIFKPLGIASAGFGGIGTPGKIDQPWPHAPDGKPMPENGPKIDNPPVLGPAGTVHMPLGDWVKFATEHLNGRAGRGKLIKSAASYEMLHTSAQPGNPYAFGWLAVDRHWGGKVITHAGSNTMNRSVAWLAPEKGFGMLAVTNSGAEAGAKALDEAVGLLLKNYRP